MTAPLPPVESVETIAGKLTKAQREVMLSSAAQRGSLTTVKAMSLPLCGVVQRFGGFNRWGLTLFGREVRLALLQRNSNNGN